MKNNESSNIIKRTSKLRKILFALSGLLPFVLIVGVVIIVVIGIMWPIFFITSFVGGSTVYDDSDMPSELEGIENWSDEERKFFDILELENGYYNDDFTHYNANKILKDKEEELAVSIPVATVSYQGTTDINSFDEEYDEEYFANLDLDNEYNGEKHVYTQETRSFYKQAGEKVGNTFMIYPGMRMLLGYLVGNEVDFYVHECDYRECTSSSFSNWSLLGKITSSNETDASNYYTVSDAIEQIEKAIKYGEDKCDGSSGDWETQNICYDTDSLFDEIFGERFSLKEKTIIEYLQEEFEYDNAKVPLESKIDENGYYPAGNYINVTVKKSMDYELYSDYLKDIYIPYIYINCDSCGYKNESEELKKDETERIYNEISGLISTFMTYNDEDYMDQYGSEAGDISGGGTNTVAYSCSDGASPNIVSYYGHKGRDLNGVPVGTQTYPLFEGTVVSITGCNVNYPPEVHYDDSGSEYYTCERANNNNCGYGNMVKIQGTAADGVEYYAIYGHLSRIDVSVGDKVDMNTVIGLLGNTGCSTGAHLHLELRKVSNNAVVYADNIYTKSAVQSVLCSR